MKKGRQRRKVTREKKAKDVIKMKALRKLERLEKYQIKKNKNIKDQ